MDSKTKEILQKFSTQKVDLARSAQIIKAANKLMNKSENIQDTSDSKLKLFEKTFDDLVLPIFRQRLSQINPKAKIKRANKKKYLDQIVNKKFINNYFKK